MKKYIKIFFGACIFCTLFTAQAWAREVIIHNACDFPLDAIYLGISSSDKAYSILDAPLKPQEAVKVDLDDKDVTWTIIAQDPDGSKVTFENISFKGINQIHIKSDGTVEIYR